MRNKNSGKYDNVRPQSTFYNPLPSTSYPSPFVQNTPVKSSSGVITHSMYTMPVSQPEDESWTIIRKERGKAYKECSKYADGEYKRRMDGIYDMENVANPIPEHLLPPIKGNRVDLFDSNYFTLPAYVLDDAIQIWDFIVRFDKTLGIPTLSWKNFETALLNPSMQLNAEIHIALLRILIPSLPTIGMYLTSKPLTLYVLYLKINFIFLYLIIYL